MTIETEIAKHKYKSLLIRHVQVSRNFGNLGGWLRCEIWTSLSGDPIGITQSRIEYPGGSK